jgi:hypothetical protein
MTTMLWIRLFQDLLWQVHTNELLLIQNVIQIGRGLRDWWVEKGHHRRWKWISTHTHTPNTHTRAHTRTHTQTHTLFLLVNHTPFSWKDTNVSQWRFHDNSRINTSTFHVKCSILLKPVLGAWTVTWNFHYEQVQSNRACNIFNFVVLCLL